ncbi:MAG: alpha/beta hydrolase [Phycisphaeraceae bacterium]
MFRSLLSLALLLTLSAPAFAADAPPVTLNLWPATPPGDENVKLDKEQDITKDTDRPVAGKRIIKLANVSTPQIVIYRPAPEKDTGTSVIICPGGGHFILAWDLEGTEVAQWLNTIGVTGIVLKYRVPGRDKEMKWKAAVQDAQRAVSLVRSKAGEWKLDPKRIGILGFSAGGETAGRAAIFVNERQYEAIDDVDKVSSRPDFTLLIYPAYFADKDQAKLRDDVKVTKEVPPMFLVHAYNDGVTPMSSLLLATELKKVGVAAELHLYATGGHGFGLRPTDEPCTRWPALAENWLRKQGLLKMAEKPAQ